MQPSRSHDTLSLARHPIGSLASFAHEPSGQGSCLSDRPPILSGTEPHQGREPLGMGSVRRLVSNTLQLSRCSPAYTLGYTKCALRVRIWKRICPVRSSSSVRIRTPYLLSPSLSGATPRTPLSPQEDRTVVDDSRGCTHANSSSGYSIVCGAINSPDSVLSTFSSVWQVAATAVLITTSPCVAGGNLPL